VASKGPEGNSTGNLTMIKIVLKHFKSIEKLVILVKSK
jgi:hypothetical protein